MKYISTRGKAPEVPFDEALLAGLAPDGGLYMPAAWPDLPPGWQAKWRDAPYTDVTHWVANAFAGDCFEEAELASLVAAAYARFDSPDVAPLRELGPDFYLLELFHGPTLAFKDFAMQLLAQLFDAALSKRGERRTIVVATSGDTGAAAVEAFGGRDAVDLFVMHPKRRISDAQRRQMTTSTDENVHNIAVDGTFDDCQRILKDLFADQSFAAEVRLGAVNSINWARIMAQTAYYLSTLARLGRPAAFSVPTGNFGDIFAGYVARQMGADLGPLLIATNENDILHRTLQSGTYEVAQAISTLSPAMDIQVASNFERLLFDSVGRDAEVLTQLMSDLSSSGIMNIPPSALDHMRQVFLSEMISDTETRSEILSTYESGGVLVDPHTAVGLRAARKHLNDGTRVVLSTAHPAKFENTVKEAAGVAPQMPAALARLSGLKETFETLAPQSAEVAQFVRDRARTTSG